MKLIRAPGFSKNFLRSYRFINQKLRIFVFSLFFCVLGYLRVNLYHFYILHSSILFLSVLLSVVKWMNYGDYRETDTISVQVQNEEKVNARFNFTKTKVGWKWISKSKLSLTFFKYFFLNSTVTLIVKFKSLWMGLLWFLGLLQILLQIGV